MRRCRCGKQIKILPHISPALCVEVPCRIDTQGFHPLPAPEYLLPLELRTLLYSLALYEELAAPAIIEHNRDLALRALVAHPMVHTVERAERVLNAVWPTGGI
jgi:6-phospho-beta-glucosidase